MSSIIRCIDVETTGLAPPEAAICEIGFCDILSDRTDLAGSPFGWKVIGGRGTYVNPGRPIPPEVSAVHHITDEDVAGADPWELASLPVMAQGFRMGFPIVALAAHSAKFERSFVGDDLIGKRPLICTYKCALRLYPDAPSYSNQALRYWRKPSGLDRSVADPAHRAFPDAYVTSFLLRDMLEVTTVDQLVEWSSQPALQVRCHIGKWRGAPWREVDYGFLEWVSSRDFDEDVIFTVKTEMERRRKEDEASVGGAQ